MARRNPTLTRQQWEHVARLTRGTDDEILRAARTRIEAGKRRLTAWQWRAVVAALDDSKASQEVRAKVVISDAYRKG